MGKIVNNGDGSALMKNPELAARIVEAVVHAVSVPVTAKIRRGWDMAIAEGRLQIRDWTDKDGNKRKSAEVVADNVYFGDSKRDGAGDGGYAPSSSAPAPSGSSRSSAPMPRLALSPCTKRYSHRALSPLSSSCAASPWAVYSTFPPPMVPVDCPPRKTAIIAPVPRGVDPLDFSRLTRQTGRPASSSWQICWEMRETAFIPSPSASIISR